MKVRHQKIDSKLPWIGAIGLALGVGILYFFAAQLSLELLVYHDGFVAFWLAAGLSAGLLIAIGPSARLPITAGVMAATMTANIVNDRNVWGAAAYAFCNAAEPLFVAWIIDRYFGPGFSLGRLHNVLGLMAAAVVAAAVSGGGGMVAYKVFQSPTAQVWTTWYHWFAADALGIAAVAPAVIGIAEALRKPAPRREMIEWVAALMTLTVTIIIVLLSPYEPWQVVRPNILLFPVLLWLASRCQPAFAAVGAFIVSLTIVFTTTFGIGPLGNPAFSIGNRILAAHIAIAASTLFTNVLAALFAERRQAHEHQDLLISELNHRVKNVLARVAAVLNHTKRSGGTVEEFIRSVEGRIQSMVTAHALLTQSRWHGVALIDLLRRQLAPYTNDANISFEGPDLTLTSGETQALAMVIHELVTNAVKYGALSSPGGSVPISWNCTAGDLAVLTIVWREVRGPPVVASVQFGYGSNLIRNLIPYELGGAVELTYPRDGVCCKIEIPLKRRCFPSAEPDRR